MTHSLKHGAHTPVHPASLALQLCISSFRVEGGCEGFLEPSVFTAIINFYHYIPLVIPLFPQIGSLGLFNLIPSFYVINCLILTALHGMQNLNSLTRDGTRAPCSGSVESQPLDHQGTSLFFSHLNSSILMIHPCHLLHSFLVGKQKNSYALEFLLCSKRSAHWTLSHC